MSSFKSTEALRAIESRLAPNLLEHVSVRGLEDGPFLFAKQLQRAVEVSTNEGNWWVEFWDNTLGDDSPPEKEATYNSVDEMLKEVREWLGVQEQ